MRDDVEAVWGRYPMEAVWGRYPMEAVWGRYPMEEAMCVLAPEPEVELAPHLTHRLDVAERAEAVRSAFRDHVGRHALALELAAGGFHDPAALAVFGGRDEADLCAGEAIEKHVARDVGVKARFRGIGTRR